MSHISTEWIVNLSTVDHLIKEANEKLRKFKDFYGKLPRSDKYHYLYYGGFVSLPGGQSINQIIINKTEEDITNMINDLNSYKLFLTQFPNIDSILIHYSIMPLSQHKYIYYLYKDRHVDMIKQYFMQDLQFGDYEKLQKIGIYSQIIGNNIYIPNLDASKYWILQEIFKDLHPYKNITGKTFNVILKSIIEQYPSKIKEFAETHINSYLEYADWALDKPEYYQSIYDLGLLFILNNPNVEAIKKTYYILAQIIISNPGQLTEDEKILIFDYLLKADDYKDAKDLRDRLFWDWAGYGFGTKPFSINFDIETIIKLGEELKKNRSINRT